MTTYSLYMTYVSMSVVAVYASSEWAYVVWQLAADSARVDLSHASLRTTNITFHISAGRKNLAHIWGADHNI